MTDPIDRIQSILQSNVTERVQQIQQQHADMQQRYFDIQLRQERMATLQKVNDSKETDRLILKDKEEKKRRNHRQEDETAQRSQRPETPGSPDHPLHVDIKA